jgi:DNA-directed RNA polymerase subunit F
MAIKEEKPITMAEVNELVKDSEKSKEIKDFIKKFGTIKFENAMKLKEELKSLDLIKLKDDHIVKIVDFMPTDTSEINKILPETSLDGEEMEKILNVVKKY